MPSPWISTTVATPQRSSRTAAPPTRTSQARRVGQVRSPARAASSSSSGSARRKGFHMARVRGDEIAQRRDIAPGRILRIGGGSINANVKKPGKRAASIIDLNSGSPVITKLPPMPWPLHWANTTVLPNGKVVITGGSSKNNELAGANYNALLWDPARPGVWTVGARTGASAPHARLYHSIAMLLPDASVLVGGSGANGARAPSPTENTNAEIYYPPYLFTAAGQWAPRPRIVQAPPLLTTGSRFAVTVDNPLAIARVTLVRTGSVTHSFNMDQRFVDLPFTAGPNGTLNVQIPARASDRKPGGGRAGRRARRAGGHALRARHPWLEKRQKRLSAKNL